MYKIIVNPDKDFVKEVKKAIKDNGGHCPCSLIKNKDTKCICKEFREQDEEGYCKCGLYMKKFEDNNETY